MGENNNNGRLLRVALVQHRRDRHNPDDNLVRLNDILPGISGVDLVLLPEAWRGPKLMQMAELEALLEHWGGIAAAQKYTLITGGIFVNTGPRVLDLCHVISPDGAVLGVTEKVFPSLPVGERTFVTGGEKLPVFEVAGVKFGILICIDMMYPELARSLVLRGAEVIFNPANIPKNRIDMWHSMLSIRAAENTVFTLFANNTGTTYPDDRSVMGGSSGSRPIGVQFFTADEAPAVHYLEMNTAEIAKIRPRWPYIEDIRGIEDFSGESVVRK